MTDSHSIKFDLTLPPPDAVTLADARNKAARILDRVAWRRLMMIGVMFLWTLCVCICVVAMIVSSAYVASLVAFLILFLPLAFLDRFMSRWVIKPGALANEDLAALVEMEPSTLPNQCIQLMAWGDTHDVVQDYQQQLAAMGRHPVVGEYNAVRLYVANIAWSANDSGKKRPDIQGKK